MRRLTLLACLTLFLTELPGRAEASGIHGASDWHRHGWVILLLAFVVLFYIYGLISINAREHRRPIIGMARAVSFGAGVLVVIVALEPPIDTIGAALFSVHMVQHLLLILIAAPLIVIGRPGLVMFSALPRRSRLSLSYAWKRQRTLLPGLFVSPIAVWLWFTGLFMFWHLPGPYTLALQSSLVHVLEHLCFFLSAYAFWSIVIEPSGRRRLDYGATILFVATVAFLSALPGALIALAPRPFYTLHVQSAAQFGLTPIEDQQLAGLIMWIPAGFAYMAAILALLALWIRQAERRARSKVPKPQTMIITCLALFVVLAGCSDNPWAGEEGRFAGASFGGDPEKGADEIQKIGCGACHIIPGIAGANGLVGPPLSHMGRRIFIAGLLRNTPENLMMWLRDPQKIVPGNAMPNLGLTDDQTKDIAAYLYTLQ